LEAAYPTINKATISSDLIQETNVFGIFGTTMASSKNEPKASKRSPANIIKNFTISSECL